MSFEQKRNAERLPLITPIEATAGGMPATIVEMSAIGCKIEHKEKMSIGSEIGIKFTWQGKKIDLRGKIARTQMRSAYPDGMFYQSGVKLADSLDEAPEKVRMILESLVEGAALPGVEPKPEPEPAAESEPELQIEPEADLEMDIGAPVARVEEEAVAEVEEAEDEFEAPLEFEDIPPRPVAFPTQKEVVALAVEPEPEPEPEVVKREYVECVLENGKWKRRVVTAVLQPAEGFITAPADEHELNMLCKSYEYADPDTRRLIRISLELAATKD